MTDSVTHHDTVAPPVLVVIMKPNHASLNIVKVKRHSGLDVIKLHARLYVCTHKHTHAHTHE